MKDTSGFLTEAMEQAFEDMKAEIKRKAEDEMHRVKAEMTETERRDLTEKAIDEKAAITRGLYERYLDVGFTAEQAWELVKIHAQMSPLFSPYGYCNA